MMILNWDGLKRERGWDRSDGELRCLADAVLALPVLFYFKESSQLKFI